MLPLAVYFVSTDFHYLIEASCPIGKESLKHYVKMLSSHTPLLKMDENKLNKNKCGLIFYVPFISNINE